MPDILSRRVLLLRTVVVEIDDRPLTLFSEMGGLLSCRIPESIVNSITQRMELEKSVSVPSPNNIVDCLCQPFGELGLGS